MSANIEWTTEHGEADAARAPSTPPPRAMGHLPHSTRQHSGGGTRARILLLHGFIGAVVGYIVLHPAAMLIHRAFEIGLEDWSGAVALAFNWSHVSMAVYFVALGAVGGVVQGVYVHGLAQLNQRLKLQSRTDDLTGLFNRRHLFYLLGREVSRVRRNGGELCLAILDVDHFKQYNDSHGHPAGDDVLHVLGQLLARSVREVDIVARYGGEEFVLVFPGAGRDPVGAVLERIRVAVRDHSFLGAQTQPARRVTVSIGFAELGNGSSSEGELMRHADAALYEAKRSGRDRTHGWRRQPVRSLAAE